MKMKNGEITRIFTARLDELCSSGVSLKEALGVLKDLKNSERQVRLLCAELLYALESGSSFSMALRKCKTAYFSRWYIGFIEVAEENGNLEKTLSFLSETLETRSRELRGLFANLLYPALLIVFASTFGIFLEKLFGAGNFIHAFLFLANVSTLLLLIMINSFNEKPVIFFLNALSFLWERNVPLEKSLERAAACISYDQKLFQAITKIKDEILAGENVAECFEKNFKEVKFAFAGKILGMNLALNLAGNKSNPFEKSLAVIKAKNDKQKRIFLRLEQPVLLFTAAIFILLVVGDLKFLYEVAL